MLVLSSLFYRYECIIERAGHAHICQSAQGFLNQDEVPMTEDRTSASAERLKGSVKEAIGKLTGDARAEADGRRQKRGDKPPGADAPRND